MSPVVYRTSIPPGSSGWSPWSRSVWRWDLQGVNTLVCHEIIFKVFQPMSQRDGRA